MKLSKLLVIAEKVRTGGAEMFLKEGVIYAFRVKDPLGMHTLLSRVEYRQDGSGRGGERLVKNSFYEVERLGFKGQWADCLTILQCGLKSDSRLQK